jgi:cbb3-type cytochrome oxidase maturation protein
MSIAYLLVTLGLGVFGLAIWALFWAIDSGQFDDLDSQGGAILEEDVAAPSVSERPPKS